jgi:hypothetical protein
MKQLFPAVLFMMCATGVHAQEVATCKDPEGWAYVVQGSNIPPGKAGWQRERLSRSVFTIQKTGPHEFDVLYLDEKQKMQSSKDQGAKVFYLGGDDAAASFLVAYDYGTAFVYSLFTESGGQVKLSILTSQTGKRFPVGRQGVMVGNCERWNFGVMR